MREKLGHWSFLLQRQLNENHNLEHQGAQRHLQKKDPEKTPILAAPRHRPPARIQMLFQKHWNTQKTCFQQSSMHKHRCNRASKRVDHILEQKQILRAECSVHQALIIGNFQHARIRENDLHYQRIWTPMTSRKARDAARPGRSQTTPWGKSLDFRRRL